MEDLNEILGGNVSLTAGVVAHDGVRRRGDAPRRRRRRRRRGHTSVAPRSGTARALIGQTLKNWYSRWTFFLFIFRR